MRRKLGLRIAAAAAAWLAVDAGTLPGLGAPFVYETEKDLVTVADFDVDGSEDVLLIDKPTGKYRLGYQETPGTFTWAKFRHTGAKYVTGLSVGNLLATNQPALVLASADESKVVIAEALNKDAAGTPIAVSISALGPHSVVAIDIGGEGNTPLSDLFLTSVYNLDPENQINLIRNTAVEAYSELGSAPLPGKPAHGNAIQLKAGGPEYAALIIRGEGADTFQLQSFASGKPETVGSIGELPAESDYVIGRFGPGIERQIVFYQPGKPDLFVQPLEQGDGNKVTFGPRKALAAGEPIKHLVVLPHGDRSRLLAIHGKGESVGVYDFDAAKAPVRVENIVVQTNELIFSAAAHRTGFVLFGATAPFRVTSKYHLYDATPDGKWAAGPVGGLPTLEDSDEWTVPEIHKAIAESLKEQTEADMKWYTNTIPGTAAKYVMVPIPGGEFVMGSPAGEANRNVDEGPQHKVKVEPFWMGRYEVTWNEYEVFMYLEDERKLREMYPIAEDLVRVSDAVTRPSRPYVEMSFGMGKDGYPAISMTHQSATKFCQWLSAKTGHFYRLPTEAEWEYACRAGTTTAYYFGDDSSKLNEHAWWDENGDGKYQKVGKKKPNPWGLHDMHGNVAEWCLDQYDPKFYEQFADKVTADPWNRPTERWPHAARGGAWTDWEPNALRSAVRLASTPDWQQRDPQLPRSRWWLTDAQFIGLRVVRPLKVPPAEELAKYWTSAVEKPQ